MENSGTAELLFHIVQCCTTYASDGNKWDLPMVLHCSGIMYKYYSCLGGFGIKHNEVVKDIINIIYYNIPHFIKKHLHVDCIKELLVLYK